MTKKHNNKKGKKLSLIIAAGVTLILIIGTIVVVFFVKPFENGTGSFFGYNARVVSSIPASEFKDAITVSEAQDILDERGFTDYQIMTSYSMSGEYLGEYSSDYDDEEKHPTYDIEYVTETGDLWVVYYYGDQIMANPVSYNLQSSREVRVLISEKNTITSYSGKENCFYEIIPNETELIVITVDKIDAETLEELTLEALDEL